MAAEGKFATMTLVLTPELVHVFGAGIHGLRSTPSDPWARATDLYRDTKTKNFERAARSKSVDQFEQRWQRGTQGYGRSYDQILRVFVEALGPSTFKLAYQKAIASSHAELQRVTLAVGDISELYRRHIAQSINIATHYDEIFAMNDPSIPYTLDSALRASNYGITLLYFLLSGDIPGPLWVVFRTLEKIRQCLSKAESTARLPRESGQVAGSLRIREGDLRFLDEK